MQVAGPCSGSSNCATPDEDSPGTPAPNKGAPKLSPYQRQEALKRLTAGETQTDIARSHGVSHVTVGRLLGAAGSPFEVATAASVAV